MTLTQSYETQRDLLTGMAYHRGSTLVTQREYTYDVLRRPTARTTSRQGNVVNDSFVHNTRSELASAQVNGETYGYDYDNVGNRRMSMEAGDYAFYEANALNQYTDITGAEDETDFSFTPIFDADGNQTVIKTETGIWAAVYNAENRPVSFTNEATGTVVTCAYDSMGRRSFKQVTVNGTVTLHQRYLYRGYLQIACIDLTRSHHPGLWLITWDPTEPIATRPLAIQKDGTWYTYGLDLAKNVCEVFGSTGYIATTYAYTPYGSVTATGSVTQPILWSSENYDQETSLSYYNYRYFNNVAAKWLSRDLLNEEFSNNLYNYCNNYTIINVDLMGAAPIIVMSDAGARMPSISVVASYYVLIYYYEKAIHQLNEINSKDYEKLQEENKIRWNSVIFSGTKQELIDLIRRECDYIDKVTVVSDGGWRKTKQTLQSLIPHANKDYDAIYLITHGNYGFYFQLGNGKSERYNFNNIQIEFNTLTQSSPAAIKKILACYYCVPYEIEVKLTAKTEVSIDSKKCTGNIDITPIRAMILPRFYTLPPIEMHP